MQQEAVILTLVLAAMCGTMWYLARLARRRMGIGAGTVSVNALRVVGKRPLDQRSSLYVIEIAGGRHILVGSSLEGGVSKIDDISADEFAAMSEVADTPRIARLRAAEPGDDTEQRFATVGESFAHLLGKARGARAGRHEGRAAGE